MVDYAYDFETYPNMFSGAFVDVISNEAWEFEISDRVDQTDEFIKFIYYLRDSKSRGAGFNNEGFDYLIAHFIVQQFEFQGFVTAEQIKQKQIAIFADGPFAHMIWPDRRLFPQVDLYKIHHFDNKAKRTSLKKLQVNTRSMYVVDLPYDPTLPLTHSQMDEVKRYGMHDVMETVKFYWLSKEKIDFRDHLADLHSDLGDVVNFNDTKIGKKYFETELEKVMPGSCFHNVNGRREPRQTRRDSVMVGDVISPKICFKHPEFNRVLNHLRDSEIYDLRDGFGDLHANVDGFKFHIGAGGLHGSLSKQIQYSSNEYDIIDVDVASYYPNIAITNRFYPEHLSESFCDIYENVYQMRKSYPKKSAENAMLKLALNGVYGDSNNDYSPFHDPKYTLSVTINGQLLLCMLAEWLLQPGVSIIQANTDGLTMRVHKNVRQWFMDVCKYWESYTGLELEYVDYDRMIIRDVNNYMAVKKDGSIKRIGAYKTATVLDDPHTREHQWHSNQNCLVVQKAAEAALVYGKDPAKFIMAHRDPFDFMLSIKVARSHQLQLDGDPPEKIQNITRYYISTQGRAMSKLMPPLARAPDKWRKNSINAGWKVRVVNDASLFNWSDLNWLFYITEAKKLIDCIDINIDVVNNITLPEVEK